MKIMALRARAAPFVLPDPSASVEMAAAPARLRAVPDPRRDGDEEKGLRPRERSSPTVPDVLAGERGPRPRGQDMPEDKARKRAVRARMAQTGERYTTAARKLGTPSRSEQLGKTLTEQGEQLDKAQSDQLDRTFAEQRTRTLNERFDTVAGQLASDRPPAVRMAGVYAMAGLADDWQDNRQMCVDVLCAYLRMPYEPEPGDDASVEKRLAFQANREVRHTVIRVIAAHLNGTAPVSWCGLNFDFAGAVFDGGDFSGAKFCSTEAFTGLTTRHGWTAVLASEQ